MLFKNFFFFAVGLVALPTIVKGDFELCVEVPIDGEIYYLMGPGESCGMPGHYWELAGPRGLQGKMINEGPDGAPKWWSSDAPDKEFLYTVHGIIDTWSQWLAEDYAADGYVHRHLLRNSDGELHPNKVLWLKHTARTSFTFDATMPLDMHGLDPHEVTPGIDYEWLPNWDAEYPMGGGHHLRH